MKNNYIMYKVKDYHASRLIICKDRHVTDMEHTYIAASIHWEGGFYVRTGMLLTYRTHLHCRINSLRGEVICKDRHFTDI